MTPIIATRKVGYLSRTVAINPDNILFIEEVKVDGGGDDKALIHFHGSTLPVEENIETLTNMIRYAT